MTFLCTIYNEQVSADGSGHLTPAVVTLVARSVVRAGSRRSAAAKVYVRCVGRQRARLLKEVLHAPSILIRHETDWRGIAPGLTHSSNRLGDCYCFDSLFELWYIAVAPAGVPLPAKRLLSASRTRLTSLKCASPN
jgi:hypothetical protein